MPQTIEIPNVGQVEFPDTMSDADITSAIKTRILPQAKKESLKAEQRSLEAQPDPSVASEFAKQVSAPFIDIPKPTINPEDSALTKAGKGVVQSLAVAAETLASPLGISTAALSAIPVAGPVIRAVAGVGFGAAGLLKGIQQMWSAAVNRDPAEAGRGVGNLLLGGAALGGAAKALAPEEAAIPLAPKTTEALKVSDDNLVRLPGEAPGVVSAPEVAAAAPPDNITSLKNAVVDVKRVEQGLPEAEPVLRRSFGDAWDQAQEKIAKDPNYQNDLIDELRRKPRAVTDTEDAALLQRQVELENASLTAQKEIIDAADKGDAAAVAEAKVRFNVLSDQLLDLYNVGKRAGTETARGLAARKMLADEQFNLTSMITQKRAANGGRRLTEPETEKITALKNDIDASQQALDEYQAEHFDRPPTKLDEDFLRLQAQNVRLKTQFQQELAKDRLTDRSFVLKAADFWSKWRRFQLLSGPRTLGKLTAAAALRMAVTPLKEAVGAGIGAVIPGISEGARIEGGFSIRGEANALTQFFTQGMRDAWQVLRTGTSDLDTVYGKLHELEPSVLDFFGHLHGALKAPLKRAAFARAFAKGIEFDMRNGVDVTDPLVQTRNAVLAYKEAQRAIFMEDNRLVEGFNAGLRVMERPSQKTGESSLAGKGVATAVRTEVPIVRVPSNIVAQAFEHAFGLVTGSTRLALAYRKGFETLSEGEKELILRQLKSGSVGGTLFLIGFLNKESVGGYFQRGEKRSKADVKPDEVRIFGVDIPSAAMHEPSLEVLQLGATIRRVADAKLRKRDREAQGIPAGAMAGALGLIEESPFIRDMLDTQKAFDPQSRDAFFGELAKSIVVPQALSQIASQGVPFTGGVGGDVDAAGEPIKRQPQGILEHIESGIPILREDLAKKTDKKQGLHDPFKP